MEPRDHRVGDLHGFDVVSPCRRKLPSEDVDVRARGASDRAGQPSELRPGDHRLRLLGLAREE